MLLLIERPGASLNVITLPNELSLHSLVLHFPDGYQGIFLFLF